MPTLFSSAAVVAPAPEQTPAPTQPEDTGWLAGDPGVELRRLRVPGDPGASAIPVIVVRVDPARVRLRVAYAPDQPRSLHAWFDERRPILAINGGFFAADYRSTALVISDGAASGESYEGFGGMLAVDQQGGVTLRALRDQPYDPAEALAQTIQSAPMLIFPGGALADIGDDGERARRTAVALDQSGNLLLIVCPTSGFTLRGLAGWLASSDLNIDRALNLDGGSSTGLFLTSGALSERIDSFGPLPLVLLVESK